ncbi:uncharacterized protein KY384_005007 [Bacidia gigantensis]|uniref:uncharacterized protein n=1 Tax=Bacidia gigantensis TaxID=2732470 RepID=UPI001D053E6D|nr:uncharacterized protein KY384_005007 [Bacidia gigantensis]KAG8530504.1 hypothetical protein KY384_005007 [Bacidia gigantensis]
MGNQPKARYSYQETPVEMQRSVFLPFSSPTNSVIDESPISAATASRSPPGYDQLSPTPLPTEKSHTPAPPPESHPAYNAPVAEPAAPTRQPQQPPPLLQAQQAPQTQHIAIPPPDPPVSPGPLPVKPRENPRENTMKPAAASPPPPKFGIDRADTYNPHSLQGPNVSPENHRPGQVSHPNASVDPHWKHGLSATGAARSLRWRVGYKASSPPYTARGYARCTISKDRLGAIASRACVYAVALSRRMRGKSKNGKR